MKVKSIKKIIEAKLVVKSLPDIDTDFESIKRNDVKRYLEERYGETFVCSVGTNTSLQLKAALKDLGRVENIPVAELNYITKVIQTSGGQSEDDSWQDIFTSAVTTPVIKTFIKNNPQLVNYIRLCLGQPRSKSIHACATMIIPKIGDRDIFTSFPVRDENGVLVSEWEGGELEKVGYLKEDILGIRELDKFRFIVNLIKTSTGRTIDIYNVPVDDRGVYNLFQKGYTGNAFHFGSRGLTNYGIQLKPDKIDELIAMIAIYRPGPIYSGAHTDFIKRKFGEVVTEYDFGCQEITKNTYGLYIYQEQIMMVCQKVAGFSLIEADDVRKAMGKLDRKLIESYKLQFIEGCTKNSCPQEEAEKIWQKMESFAEYGFNKCVAGSERFLRRGQNTNGESSYSPTIGEMYRIMNNRRFAIEKDNLCLHYDYKKIGYGCTYSMNNTKDKIILNRIKDIRYQGVKPVYQIVTTTGPKGKYTLNHKFPTTNGEKKLEDIDIKLDRLYIKKEGSFDLILEDLLRIEFAGEEETYDVEMKFPFNTFTLDSGLVSCNSHAACYALTGYISQWLKYHYPIQFWTAALEFETDKEEILRYVSEINKTSASIKVLPPDINISEDKFITDFQNNTIYWALSSVRNCGEVATSIIFKDRQENGPYFSLEEFLKRIDTSKVNKTVVENLILSGCFDQLEKLEKIQDRLLLISKYREIAKVKPSKTDWLLTIDSKLLEKEYWFLLRQRVTCGLSFFNFERIIRENSEFDKSQYLPFEKFSSEESSEDNIRGVISGIVSEVNVRSSKKGDWAQIKIESNGDYSYILLWNEYWDKFKSSLEGSEDRILIISGKVIFDNYKKENILQVEEHSKIKVLD